MPRLFVVLLLVAVGCADADRPPPPVAPSDTAEGAEPLRPGVGLDRLLAARGDQGPFLADLRPPRTLTVEAVENRHVAGQVDTVRTRDYDGLTVESYEVSGGPTFIQRVTVTDVGYGTASGLAIDELRTDVERVLGPPIGSEGGAEVYETGDPAAPTVVEVTYEPDERGRARTTRITWRPYVD